MTTTGAERISIERSRQIEIGGWTATHDEEHTEYQLTRAAIAYALNSIPHYFHLVITQGKEPNHGMIWPWDQRFWKPKTPIRNLVRAGALIAAEIDRRILNGETE